MPNTEIAIIGAGPIGIELATEFKRLGLDYRHFEAGQIGSTIGWFAPGTTFFSSPERIAIAGIPLEVANQAKATREQYLAYLRQVVVQFDLHIETFREVSSIERKDGKFLLSIVPSRHGYGSPCRETQARQDELEVVSANKVVLAIGDMHQPQPLGVPGEDSPHVSHYLEDPHLYFRKRVLIVGGKNSAIEAAIRLYRGGSQVAIAHRGEEINREEIKYWLYPEIKELIRRGYIRYFGSTNVVSISRPAVELNVGGSNQTIPADFVLLLTGYRQDQKLLQMAGIEIQGPAEAPAYNSDTMETNVPGIFVAGTAVAGRVKRQGYKEFIETSHIHVERIVRALGYKPRDLKSFSIPFELRES